MSDGTPRWAVTGAAGFLGSHVVDQLLESEQQVLALDNLSWGHRDHFRSHENNPRCTTATVDIRDLEALTHAFTTFRPDHIVHLAALHFIPETVAHPSTAVHINVHGTQCVLEASRATDFRSLFFASTGDVYAISAEPHSEDSPLQPTNIYGLTKYVGERLVELESGTQTDRQYVCGRLFNLIGARETNPHILPEVIEQLKNTGDSLRLGNLWPLRDYVPVADAARAIIDIVPRVEAALSTYNIATGKPHSVQEIIGTIQSLLGRTLRVVKDDARVRAVDRKTMSADVSKLRRFLGWTPSDDFESLLSALLVSEGLLREHAV